MIFLSASIPYKDRDPKYYTSADVIAIRDSVRALATVVIPNSKLVWGGHPAITPLIRYVLNTMNKSVNTHVTLYQSDFFKANFPIENGTFENLIRIVENKDRDSSLLDMRSAMFKENKFSAGVFIGGMDGVEIEYEMFKSIHPNAILLPIASTGAAAKIIYEKNKSLFDKRLLTDYSYISLFKELLMSKI
jgi:hypothetical protein